MPALLGASSSAITKSASKTFGSGLLTASSSLFLAGALLAPDLTAGEASRAADLAVIELEREGLPDSARCRACSSAMRESMVCLIPANRWGSGQY